MRISFAVLLLLAGGASAYDLQAAIDANPGGTIEVPAETCTISAPIRITQSGTQLTGALTVVQTDPAQLVLHVEGANDVRIEGLTFTRAKGQQDAEAGGIRVTDSHNMVLDRVRVIDCKAREAAIALEDSSGCVIRDCDVRNYKRIAVDDRTETELYGYAFRAIDGTGILVARCQNVVISGNRIIEEALLPTAEMKEQHQLGSLTEGRKPTKPGKLGEGAVAAGYVSNWHQGSAIVVTGPTETRHVQVLNNHLVNAAQGIDLHCDYTLVSGNLIDHCMIGLKATHGCEGLSLVGNTVTHADLWGILLNPGAISSEANPDRGILVANNTIVAYGHGHEYWNWGGREPGAPGSYAIALYDGQLAENPPLRDLLVTGNMVAGNDGAPRYRYAVFIGSWHGPIENSPNMPENPQFSGNHFAPGLDGVSNGPLAP
jgi:hypothetical protein